MDMHFNTENDFTEFKKEIGKRLRSRNKLKAGKVDAVPSAVMMLILNKNNEAHVFLTKRTQNVRTHKGQVSFPGGMREESDKTILDTALRETCEETGINAADIEIIGEFDEVISVTNFHVSTFIGSIKYPYEYRVNANEIEACFEVPLSIFYNREYYKTEDHYHMGENRKVYFYSYLGFEIWGMTAGILTRFASIILREEK